MLLFPNVRGCAVVGAGRGRQLARATGQLAAGLALLATAGCGSGHDADCLKSNGPVTVQRRELPATLSFLVLFDNVDVTIVPDTAIYAEVRAGKNVIDDITFTQHGPNQLVIRNTSRCNWVRSYDTPREVRLHVRRLHDIEQRGYGLLSTASTFRQDTLFVHNYSTGDVNMDVHCQYLFADVYDAGDVTLRGTTTEFHPNLGSNGFLFASDLQTTNCYYHFFHENIGDAHVRASGNLGGLHDGRGTLYYTGHPGYLETHGAGKVVAE